MKAIALLLFAAAAAAQPAEPAPAASPAASPAAAEGAPAAAPPPAAPLAIPVTPPAALSPAKLTALRTYKNERLVMRDELEITGGGYSVVGGGWGNPYGPWGGPWGWGGQSTVVLPQPTQVNRGWALYQGKSRLDPLRFLAVTGQADLRASLEEDIRTYRRRGAVWFSVAGVGLAGILGGMVALDMATTRDQAVLANRVVLGSTAGAAVGLVAGSFPRARSDRLARDPSATLSAAEAQRLADAHNDALRAELGLAPADVWALEVGEGAP